MSVTFMLESPKCADLCASLYTKHMHNHGRFSNKMVWTKIFVFEYKMGMVVSTFSTLFSHLGCFVGFFSLYLLKKDFCKIMSMVTG